MKILVTGDREFACFATVKLAYHYVEHTYGPIKTVVHGAARGADQLAGMVALDRNIGVVPMPAQWNRYGKGAGPIRNQRMLDDHPDIKVVLAFHENLKTSKGTKDMLSRALKKLLSVFLFTPKQVDYLQGFNCPKCVTEPLHTAQSLDFAHETKVCQGCNNIWHKNVHYR
jgi:hypothetical protein